MHMVYLHSMHSLYTGIEDAHNTLHVYSVYNCLLSVMRSYIDVTSQFDWLTA